MHAARQKTTAGPTSLPEGGTSLLVGTVHDAASLRVACRPKLEAPDVDVFEVRLDQIVPPADAWERLLRRQIILTARHPAEGGPAGLGAAARRKLLREHLAAADALDLELRSFPAFRGLAEEATDAGAARIISFHDFRSTPSVAKLREVAARAADEGADIVKIAAMTNTAAELARLLSFAAGPQPCPLACMGMGALGRVSRLLLGSLGTALVYCALAGANAPGQWPVKAYRAALRGLSPR